MLKYRGVIIITWREGGGCCFQLVRIWETLIPGGKSPLHNPDDNISEETFVNEYQVVLPHESFS